MEIHPYPARGNIADKMGAVWQINISQHTRERRRLQIIKEANSEIDVRNYPFGTNNSFMFKLRLFLNYVRTYPRRN